MNLPTLRIFDGYSHTSPKLKSAVKQLQQELEAEGYTITADGFFGEGTEAAVKQFQSEKGLQSDGVVGAVTWSALLDDAPVDPNIIFSTTLLKTDAAMMKHLKAAQKYEEIIYKNSRKYDINPAIICGIGSRESAWGLALKPATPSGTGDFTPRRAPTRYREENLPAGKTGYGRGLMQIDFDAHEFARTGNWHKPEENIQYGCSVFNDCRKTIARLTQLSGLKLTQAALASYNCGAGRVVTAVNNQLDIDYYTAGRNYSQDTLNRAGFFQLNGWD